MTLSNLPENSALRNQPTPAPLEAVAFGANNHEFFGNLTAPGLYRADADGFRAVLKISVNLSCYRRMRQPTSERLCEQRFAAPLILAGIGFHRTLSEQRLIPRRIIPKTNIAAVHNCRRLASDQNDARTTVICRFFRFFRDGGTLWTRLDHAVSAIQGETDPTIGPPIDKLRVVPG